MCVVFAFYEKGGFMKRIIFLGVLLILAWGLFAQTAMTPFAGDGSATNPYQIATWQNLYWVYMRSDLWGQYFIQTADITFPAEITTWNENRGWPAIGNPTTAFSGSYNGNNYVISGLYINEGASQSQGLFGKLDGTNAEISNVHLINAQVSGTEYTGALVGENNGRVINCTSNAIVSGTSYIGGLVGYNYNYMTLCSSQGTATGNAYVGGLVGYNRGTIKNCFSQSNVIRTSGSTDVNFGSFMGYHERGTVSYSYSTGSVVYTDAENPVNKGFAGAISSAIPLPVYIKCLWDMDSSAQTSTAGMGAQLVGKTTAEMQTQLTFTDASWNFSYPWKLNVNEYPKIKSFSELNINGTGTVENPYQIANASQLVWITHNPSVWNKHFLQTANITFPAEINAWESATGWLPIGNLTMPFVGIYDGNNFSISDLYINNTVNGNIALFYSIQSNVQIKNLSILNANITGKGETAILAGENIGLISNCHVTGTVNSTSNSTGGIIGFNSGTITNCISNANVTGTYYVGGISGFSNGSISNCSNTGNITGVDYVGGVAGSLNNGTITYSSSSGTIRGNNLMGGFIGQAKGTISNCYSRANVIRNIGGSSYVGGFVGRPYDCTINNSYSTGSLTYEGTTTPTNRGFSYTGSGTNTFTSCFWDTQTSGQATTAISAGVTGKTTAEMTTDALVTPNIFTQGAWDFKGESANGIAEIWNIGNGRNNGYPYLDWQYPNDTATLPVTLSSFLAISPSSDCVNIIWTTESECDITGYHIYRNTSSDLSNAIRISSSLIYATNSSAQQTYTYEDLEVEANQTYYYWLKMIESNSATEFFGPVSIKTKDDTITPETTVITQLDLVYPNPINTSGKANFSLRVSESETASLRIYNIKGQLVREFNNITPGAHHIVWDNKDQNNKACSSGVYFYQLSSPSYFSTQKMLLIK